MAKRPRQESPDHARADVSADAPTTDSPDADQEGALKAPDDERSDVEVLLHDRQHELDEARVALADLVQLVDDRQVVPRNDRQRRVLDRARELVAG
jgi:hypothetical protein